MIKFTGIKAFEAHWQSLQSVYSLDARDSRLLIRAMGRLVDNYASQSEISAELPRSLQKVFNLLVQSYLEGYSIEGTACTSAALDLSRVRPSATARSKTAKALSPAMVAAAQRQQRQRTQPTAASEADTYIAYVSPVGHS